jgi:hypothetical protein
MGSQCGNKSPSPTIIISVAEEGATSKSAEMESEKLETTTSKDQAYKSDKIAITPARVRKEALATITPADQKISEKEPRRNEQNRNERWTNTLGP